MPSRSTGVAIGCGANARSIDIRGKDLHFVPFCCQCAAEAMDCKNWSSIAHSWQIARNHMEDTHGPTLTLSTSTIHRWNRALARSAKDGADQGQLLSAGALNWPRKQL